MLLLLNTYENHFQALAVKPVKVDLIKLVGKRGKRKWQK
jgi:hypothetical protein